MEQNFTVLRCCRRRGGGFPRAALIVAAVKGFLDEVRYLAGERGASVDQASAIGITALRAAAGSGHVDVVSCLAGERGEEQEVEVPGVLQPVLRPYQWTGFQATRVRREGGWSEALSGVATRCKGSTTQRAT